MNPKVKNQLESSWMFSSAGCGVPGCWEEMKGHSKTLRCLNKQMKRERQSPKAAVFNEMKFW